MSAPQLAPAADAPRRKRLGQWYTPPSLVDHLVDHVADHLVDRLGRAESGSDGRPRSVLDPACGDGRFLLAARRAFGTEARLVGVDIDPHAVDAARRAVPGADIRLGDALSMDVGERFDVVIGNPPFVNQLATATTRGGRSRFGGGPYADVAAEFLALAARLVDPDGGVVALVLPQSLLTSRDAGAIRRDVARRLTLTHAWSAEELLFDAHVHVCALVLTAGAPRHPVTRTFGSTFVPGSPVDPGELWGRLLITEPPDVPSSETGTDTTLGDLATFAVDFRDQYYGLVGAVADDVDGPPLVTSGLIDPGVCHWGTRPVRFAKQTFAAPRVDLDRIEPKLRRWARQRLVPKILIANQTKTVEAVIDRDGRLLPSVPVITCVPRQIGDLDALWAALSSPSTAAWVRERAAGSGLSPRVVRLTPSLLAAAPWPTDVTRTGAS